MLYNEITSILLGVARNLGDDRWSIPTQSKCFLDLGALSIGVILSHQLLSQPLDQPCSNEHAIGVTFLGFSPFKFASTTIQSLMHRPVSF